MSSTAPAAGALDAQRKERRYAAGVVSTAARKRRRRLTAEDSPTRTAIVSTGRSVSSSSARVLAMRRSSSHRPGRDAELFVEVAVERPRRQCPTWAARSRQGERPVEVRRRSSPAAGRASRGDRAGGRQRRILPLAALAVRRRGQLPADAHRQGGAVLAPDLVEAQVDGGGRGAGGRDVAVVDVEDGRRRRGPSGSAGLSSAGGLPVRGGGAPVEQAQAGPGRGCRSRRRRSGRRGRARPGPRRVSPGGTGPGPGHQPATRIVSASASASRPAVDDDVDAHRGADRAGPLGAEPEVVVPRDVRPVVAEDRGRAGHRIHLLDRSEQGDDVVRHGTNVPYESRRGACARGWSSTRIGDHGVHRMTAVIARSRPAMSRPALDQGFHVLLRGPGGLAGGRRDDAGRRRARGRRVYGVSGVGYVLGAWTGPFVLVLFGGVFSDRVGARRHDDRRGPVRIVTQGAVAVAFFAGRRPCGCW